ncbi:LPXTG cell wall anchor domain-containing protein [Companilactobacillus huachuanensis]|uniref:LPXTG cell wall anchor domain-containing protein n=1 Tax=Companilactobacillus huachuanensis TaxID=2559914 RepID=A0ABW1RP10_9LACO|nr:LPXTG cell wall anchor domain-containing protein [Companilactobacillus huachuanensis]
MKRKMRSRKILTVKKRVVGFFAIAVILLGVIGGFGFTHVIAESNSSTGGGDNRSTAVVASTSDTSDLAGGGGGSNSSVLLSSDNTGTSTGNQVKEVDTTPTVNINNMSTYPQTGDSSDIGLIITGFTILIGLFAFYGYKLRKSLKFLQVSK